MMKLAKITACSVSSCSILSFSFTLYLSLSNLRWKKKCLERDSKCRVCCLCALDWEWVLSFNCASLCSSLCFSDEAVSVLAPSHPLSLHPRLPLSHNHTCPYYTTRPLLDWRYVHLPFLFSKCVCAIIFEWNKRTSTLLCNRGHLFLDWETF